MFIFFSFSIFRNISIQWDISRLTQYVDLLGVDQDSADMVHLWVGVVLDAGAAGQDGDGSGGGGAVDGHQPSHVSFITNINIYVHWMSYLYYCFYKLI